jgi:hypothetical protein
MTKMNWRNVSFPRCWGLGLDEAGEAYKLADHNGRLAGLGLGLPRGGGRQEVREKTVR